VQEKTKQLKEESDERQKKLTTLLQQLNDAEDEKQQMLEEVQLFRVLCKCKIVTVSYLQLVQ